MPGPRSRPSAGVPAWIRLVRLPNLFTAVADPLAGWFVAGAGPGVPAWVVLPVLGASAGLYTGGLVLNDVLDYPLDRAERPERPLPRGEIGRRHAVGLGTLLLGGGALLAGLAGPWTFGVAATLLALIFVYNLGAKRSIVAGPAVLGLCRAGNFLLGMGAAPGRLWWMPVGLGLYVAILTWLARRENVRPGRRVVVTQLLLGIILVDALFVASQGDATGALLVASLLVPAAALSRWIAMT